MKIYCRQRESNLLQRYINKDVWVEVHVTGPTLDGQIVAPYLYVNILGYDVDTDIYTVWSLAPALVEDDDVPPSWLGRLDIKDKTFQFHGNQLVADKYSNILTNDEVVEHILALGVDLVGS